MEQPRILQRMDFDSPSRWGRGFDRRVAFSLVRPMADFKQHSSEEAEVRRNDNEMKRAMEEDLRGMAMEVSNASTMELMLMEFKGKAVE